MNPTSSEFGHNFAEIFSEESRKERFYEVPLFRALIRALSSASKTIQVEELHGQRSQVLFSARPPWTRRVGRCELADVCIIWFRIGRLPEVRITFMQAKRSMRPHELCNSPISPPDQAFDGDSTQFHLLTTRPKIVGRFENFDPPAHVLSSALLPSVGSYCVFHRNGAGLAQFFYASADVVTADAPPKPGQIKIKTQFLGPIDSSRACVEQKWACCPMIFGSAVYSGRIGTPIQSDPITLGWVKSFIERAAANTLADNGQVSRSFLGGFEGIANNDRAEAPAKTILLIQGPTEQTD
ncbi:MAG: hypothetical protein JWQ71_3776 [Pedosphaera sp.]|nr:hypothetical protein [Pedosphaera sp.]